MTATSTLASAVAVEHASASADGKPFSTMTIPELKAEREELLIDQEIASAMPLDGTKTWRSEIGRQQREIGRRLHDLECREGDSA